MSSEYADDETTYVVVVNHQQEYSIWPSSRDLPLGWTSVGKSGRKAECLAYIEDAWKDMRPLSVRRHAEAVEHKLPPDPAIAANHLQRSEAADGAASLVERLSGPRHPVETALRPENTPAALKACIDERHVRIRFPQTRGGTELDIQLDPAASVLSAADFASGSGTVHLEGELTLDGAKVRCVVDLDVATLRGEGHLVPVIAQSG